MADANKLKAADIPRAMYGCLLLIFVLPFKLLSQPRPENDTRTTDELFETLASDNLDIIRSAQFELERRYDDAIHDRLMDLIRTDDPRRLRAFESLDLKRERGAVELAISAISHPTDGRLRQEAIMALMELEDPRAGDVFLRVLSDETEDERPRAWAAEGLARMGDRRAIPILQRILASVSEEERPDSLLAGSAEHALQLFGT